MVVDPERTQDSISDLKNPYAGDGFFFGLNLQAVLDAEPFCPLARWLCVEWTKSGSAFKLPHPEAIRALALRRAKWDDLRSRSAVIRLCGRVSRLRERHMEDSLEIGLVDPHDPPRSFKPYGCQVAVTTTRPLTVFSISGKCLGTVLLW